PTIPTSARRRGPPSPSITSPLRTIRSNTTPPAHPPPAPPRHPSLASLASLASARRHLPRRSPAQPRGTRNSDRGTRDASSDFDRQAREAAGDRQHQRRQPDQDRADRVDARVDPGPHHPPHHQRQGA